MGEQFCIIPIHQIEFSNKNPRQEIAKLEELAANIKEYGILEPVIVKPLGDKFEVIVGERRVKAGALAGLKEVPAIVKNMTDQEADEIRLIENIHRLDLTDSEKGDAVYSLLLRYPERYENVRSVAESLKLAYGTIQGWCSKSRKLSPYVQQLVAREELTERAAQLLLKYDHEVQDKLGNAIVEFDIRGGRDGAERRFIQLYNENPVADLQELAKKAKDIQTVQVPVEQLSSRARAEIDKIIEERKEKARLVRQEAAKARKSHSEPNSDKQRSVRENWRDISTRRDSEISKQVIQKRADAIIQRLTEIEHPIQRDRMMREIPKAMEQLIKRVDAAPKRRELIEEKLTRLSDLEQEGIFLSTLWDLGERANYAGARDFYGNCPPQVVEQCLLRLTKKGDLIVDPMAGSGTTIDVCNLLDRKCLAYDINPPHSRTDIMRNDSRKLPLENDSADMVFLHPPYWDMVHYTKFEERLPDISRAETLEKYLSMLKQVFQESHRILKKEKFLCLLLGDRIKDGRFIALCRKAANLAEEVGFKDHGYAVKFTQGSTSLRKRGKVIFAEVAYTENLKIEHDLVMFFRKETSSPFRRTVARDTDRGGQQIHAL